MRDQACLPACACMLHACCTTSPLHAWGCDWQTVERCCICACFGGQESTRAAWPAAALCCYAHSLNIVHCPRSSHPPLAHPPATMHLQQQRQQFAARCGSSCSSPVPAQLRPVAANGHISRPMQLRRPSSSAGAAPGQAGTGTRPLARSPRAAALQEPPQRLSGADRSHETEVVVVGSGEAAVWGVRVAPLLAAWSRPHDRSLAPSALQASEGCRVRRCWPSTASRCGRQRADACVVQTRAPLRLQLATHV